MVENKEQNSEKVFFSGVLLLTFSTVLVKIIGFLYKLPILSLLGSEGMGYFNSAYEIYALFCVIATAGLPVALSVMISGTLAKGWAAEAERVYRTARTVFVLIGIAGSAAMIAFSDLFCTLIKSENARGCLLSISPTVFFVCLSSALRGYFQGHQKMFPTALSQLIEALGKLVFGLLFAAIVQRRGGNTASVAAAAGWGLSLGTALATVVLILEKRRFTAKRDGAENAVPESVIHTADTRTIRRELFRFAIPMTVGASLVSLIKLIDMTMILRRLQDIGYSEALANESYGSYTTLALSVFGLLPALVNSVAMPLLPLLSAAISSGDTEKQKQLVSVSYRLTAFFSIPASLGIAAFAEPLLTLLFPREAEAVAVSAPLLSLLGVSVFLSCMITATNSVLHAYRSSVKPILSMLVGAAVKTLCAYALIGNPSIGLIGAPISTFFCDAAVILLNLFFAEEKCESPTVREGFLAPLAASAGAVGVAYAVYRSPLSYVIGKGLLTTLCLSLAAGLYLLISCLTGILKEEELASMPFGKPLCRVLTSLRLLPHGKKTRSD